MAECANALLLSFVKVWLDKAKEHNSKGVTTYKKAYESLKACPMPFAHPSECQQLTGFGEKLCNRLTDELKNYCDKNGLPMPERPKKKRKIVQNAAGEDIEEVTPKKKARTAKPYVPALRSGPYAIILALATLDEGAKVGLTKPEVIELAEEHCDASFSAPMDPGSFYTAWSSMKTLITKDLVYEKGRPTRRYFLTDDGWDVAKRINMSHDPSRGRNDTFISTQRVNARSDEDVFVEIDSPKRKTDDPLDIIPQGDSSIPDFAPIILEPGTFTVELVLDVREIRAKKDRDYMQNNLITKGVTPIMKALALGDILWVAKVKDPNLLARKGAEGDEIILDYIVERKRLDDLVSSIKDGRFREQKFRLRKSGIKNVIYIIEEISMDSDHFQKYQESVASAIASTQVVDNFFVKKTQKMDDTINYLVRMTKLLKDKYEKEPLHLIPTKVLTTGNYQPTLDHLVRTKPGINYHITYPAFASLSSKSDSLTLRDVFLKMLMCTRGVTGEKALEIQKRWKTPVEFAGAFKQIQEREEPEQARKKKMELVSNEMGHLVARKKIQKALSVKIAEVWGDV